MTNWVILTIIYALGNGIFQCAKKKAVERNTIYEVLATFCLLAFLICILINRENIYIAPLYILMVFIKSLVVAFAWLIGLNALKNMSVSLYGAINLSRIVFTILFSIVLLGEKLTWNIFLGSLIVILGLLLVNKLSNTGENKETSMKYIVHVIFACILTSISGIIDKSITAHITSGQLQFWFLLFLTIIYWIILLIKQKNINFKAINKNYWILISALALAIGDKFLFMANETPESKVSVMTVIKQIKAIETIILGKIMFKDKNIINKLLCSLIIIFGIILTII